MVTGHRVNQICPKRKEFKVVRGALTEGGIKWSTTLLYIDYGALSSFFAIFSLHNSTHVSLRSTKEIVF